MLFPLFLCLHVTIFPLNAFQETKNKKDKKIHNKTNFLLMLSKIHNNVFRIISSQRKFKCILFRTFMYSWCFFIFFFMQNLRRLGTNQALMKAFLRQKQFPRFHSFWPPAQKIGAPFRSASHDRNINEKNKWLDQHWKCRFGKK